MSSHQVFRARNGDARVRGFKAPGRSRLLGAFACVWGHTVTTGTGVLGTGVSVAALTGEWVGNLAGRSITCDCGAGPEWSLHRASLAASLMLEVKRL